MPFKLMIEHNQEREQLHGRAAQAAPLPMGTSRHCHPQDRAHPGARGAQLPPQTQALVPAAVHLTESQDSTYYKSTITC